MREEMRIIVRRLGKKRAARCVTAVMPWRRPAALVTSTNPTMEGNAQPDHWHFSKYDGHNVDGAVREAAGPGLVEVARGLNCPVGSAVVTWVLFLELLRDRYTLRTSRERGRKRLKPPLRLMPPPHTHTHTHSPTLA